MSVTPPHKLRRTLVWYAFATASLVALVVGIVLVILDPSVRSGQIASSIGLNLIASVLFALTFVALANWVQDRNINETIREGFGELTERVIETMARTNRLFVPQKRYAALNPGDNFGDDYNRDMTVDLEESDFFAFYGPSARYVATRLLAARHHPQQIRIAMINPANRRAISRRASDRSSWPKFVGKPMSHLEKDLEDELLMNVVSLFDCRRLCPIEILYNYDTAVSRFVMLDQAVYVSWYHAPGSAQMEMPESYRFGKESFAYSTFKMDLNRKFEISADKVAFEAYHQDSFLIDHLNNLTGRQFTADDLDRWRKEQQQDTAGFRAFLGDLYRELKSNDRSN